MSYTLRAAATLATALLATSGVARAASVWTAVASEKIRPQEPARSSPNADLQAARNEFESFQIVVTGAAQGVSVTAGPLSGPGTLPAPKLFREDILNVTQPSSVDGGTGGYPDALVPDVDDVVGEKRNAFPFDVHDGESRAVWVEFLVPQDAPAGTYTGKVTVHTASGDTDVPVRLTVWDFALPSTASLKSAFTLTSGALIKAHGVSGEALTKIRQAYAQLALDHRISIPDLWDDGVAHDWTHIDNAYGPFLDGTASTHLAGARLTSLRSGATMGSDGEHSDWASHARAKGWMDRLFQYTCDEPPLTCAWGDIKNRAEEAKRADPDFRTLVTTDLDQASANGMTDQIDVMTPLVNYMDDRSTAEYGWTAGGDKSASYGPFEQGGKLKEVWLYQSCMSHGCGGTVDIGNPSASQLYFTGWPTYMVDASSVRARAMEWLSFRYGATGELYYESGQAFYDKDPWTDQYEFSGNGDGTLFYPGTTGRIGGQTDIPVASIRLKMIREGMEDFEYLKLLASLGGADKAKAIAAALFPRAWQTDAKPADLMAARAQLAQEILARAPHSASTAAASASGGSGPALASAAGGGCGSSGRRAEGLFTSMLVPLALLVQRLRARRRRSA